MGGATELVHATCIALDDRGVLIRGPSGSGKSDLALRCLTIGTNGLHARPMMLVADDQVAITRQDNRLIARAPAALRGKLEVRGQGIAVLPVAESAEIFLIADLVDESQSIERLPDPVFTADLCGCRLPVLRLHPFEASAAAKLFVALTMRYGR